MTEVSVVTVLLSSLEALTNTKDVQRCRKSLARKRLLADMFVEETTELLTFSVVASGWKMDAIDLVGSTSRVLFLKVLKRFSFLLR